MSLADIASLAGKIAGMPGMDLAVSAGKLRSFATPPPLERLNLFFFPTAIDLIQTAQNVKVYRVCWHLFISEVR